MPAAVAPERKRAARNHGGDGESAAAPAVAVQAMVAMATIRNLPWRSPRIPNTSCKSPYPNANAEITPAARDVVVVNSAANAGRKESVQRIDAYLAAEAVQAIDDGIDLGRNLGFKTDLAFVVH